MSDRLKLDKSDITIDADLLAQFEDLDEAVDRDPWDSEKDELLLKYWPNKKHEGVAKLLGVCSATALKRYRELT